MVFPVVMYGCESWTVKKAERQTIDAFELWCWRRLLRVPCTAMRSNLKLDPKGNQSWIFIVRTDAEAQLLWPPDVKRWLIGKDSDARKDWRQEKKATTEDEIDGWMASPTRWTWVWASSRSWWWTERPGVLQSMGSQRVRNDWASKQEDVPWGITMRGTISLVGPSSSV